MGGRVVFFPMVVITPVTGEGAIGWDDTCLVREEAADVVVVVVIVVVVYGGADATERG